MTASEMLAYLSFCPPKFEMDEARLEFNQSIKIYSPKEILIVLNRMIHSEGRNDKDAFSIFLDRIREAWHLKYEDIEKLTTGQQCNDCKVPETFLNKYIKSMYVPSVY